MAIINCTSVLNPITNTNQSTPIRMHKVQNEVSYCDCDVNKYRVVRQFNIFLYIPININKTTMKMY